MTRKQDDGLSPGERYEQSPRATKVRRRWRRRNRDKLAANSRNWRKRQRERRRSG